MRIAIIGAMDQEVSVLKGRMNVTNEVTFAGTKFFEGTLNGADVVLLQSGIGKVNAAVSTTILLERYNIDAVINTGSAGGVNPELNVGDVVISDAVAYHDVDVTAFNYVIGQVPGMPARFEADARLVEIALSSGDAELRHEKGLIVTGDSFIHEPTRSAWIIEQFDGLQAIEMEAAAIAQVCHRFEVPWVVIRALSDIAGKESNLSFDQFLETAALHSSNHIERMVTVLNEA
ncbi:MAG: 5'-methylthioadenosine/S-adenosylhomocysteine nucleosidase [Bacilli bacterium]